MEPFAVIGTIVDCQDENWSLRILEKGLLVIDSNGVIVYRGEAQNLNEMQDKFSVTKVIEL